MPPGSLNPKSVATGEVTGVGVSVFGLVTIGPFD
mgnify:CR=1 FL=1